MPKRCFSCDNTNLKEISNVYGYSVCVVCKTTLGFYLDSTIRKHILAFEKKKQEVPEKPSNREEIDYRLNFMRAEYIRKRIKLLHIQARLKGIES